MGCVRFGHQQWYLVVQRDRDKREQRRYETVAKGDGEAKSKKGDRDRYEGQGPLEHECE